MFFGGFGGGGGGGGAGGGGFFGARRGQTFDETYAATQFRFAAARTSRGNKILLASEALHTLSALNVRYPMMFRLENTNSQGGAGSTASAAPFTHVGVQELLVEPGVCHLPYWLMQHLLLKEGDQVRVKNVSLEKGTYVKMRPVSKSFLEIMNHRAVLEMTLRNFAALTQVGGWFVCWSVGGWSAWLVR